MDTQENPSSSAIREDAVAVTSDQESVTFRLRSNTQSNAVGTEGASVSYNNSFHAPQYKCVAAARPENPSAKEVSSVATRQSVKGLHASIAYPRSSGG